MTYDGPSQYEASQRLSLTASSSSAALIGLVPKHFTEGLIVHGWYTNFERSRPTNRAGQHLPD